VGEWRSSLHSRRVPALAPRKVAPLARSQAGPRPVPSMRRIGLAGAVAAPQLISPLSTVQPVCFQQMHADPHPSAGTLEEIGRTRHDGCAAG
jgi:hypothetical protein